MGDTQKTVNNATLTDICQYLRNWFDRERYIGTFAIENGAISGEFELLDGQYFRIVGSVFNDGIHLYPASDLTDETFVGAVWAMAMPPSVIALSQEIDDWKEQYSGVVNSPFTSESGAAYSYSKGSFTNADGQAWSWQDQFSGKLAQWRKI